MADKSDLLEALRQRVQDIDPVPDEPDFFTSNETLMRYLKAREYNVDEAEAQLKSTIEWRRTTKPREIDCKWCHERPGYHCMVGFDELGRPIVYSCFAQAGYRKNSVEDSLAHVTYLIENAKKTMPTGLHSWVFVMDCTGMSLPACNPKLGYGVTQILSTHYPERLGLVICINHNPVFHGVWKAMKMFLHPTTAAKVHLVRSKKKIKELFDTHFDAETSQWLQTEVKRNKESPLSHQQREFWSGPESAGDHDPRGTPTYVKKYVLPFRPSENGLNVHKPHPNVCDHVRGISQEAVPPSPSEERNNLGEAGAIEYSSDTEDGAVDELEIDEEYQIPKDAIPIEQM